LTRRKPNQNNEVSTQNRKHHNVKTGYGSTKIRNLQKVFKMDFKWNGKFLA
jgi:hypothetical protein